MTKRYEHTFQDGVERKWCGKCKKYVDIKDFNKAKTWDKLRPTCKICLKDERRLNKDKIREYNVQYWKDTHEKQSIQNKIWRQNNKGHTREYNKKYRELHGKEIDKRNWQKRKNNHEYRNYQKEYRRKYEKEKRKSDMNFKLKANISRRIREKMSATGGKKDKTCNLIGCSIYQLECHIEKKFEEYMNWSNYGNWHIDHIIPCNAFDLNNEFEKRACFHYTNLQPLWASDNIKKGDKYCEEEKKVFLSQYISLIKHI